MAFQLIRNTWRYPFSVKANGSKKWLKRFSLRYSQLFLRTLQTKSNRQKKLIICLINDLVLIKLVVQLKLLLNYYYYYFYQAIF